MPGLRDFFQQNVQTGINAQDQKEAEEQRQAGQAAHSNLEAFLKGQQSKKDFDTAMDAVTQMKGRGIKANVRLNGVDVSEAQQDPYMRMAGQNKTLVGAVNKDYQPLNQAAQAVRNTLAQLEPDETTGKVSNVAFKTALMSEIKANLDSGRGVASILPSLQVNPGDTAEGIMQKVSNFATGKGDVTTTDPILQSVRGSAMTRAKGIAQQHQDLQDKWTSQGATLAPMGDVKGVVSAAGQGVQRALDYATETGKKHGYGATPSTSGQNAPVGQPGASNGVSGGTPPPAPGGFNPDWLK